MPLLQIEAAEVGAAVTCCWQRAAATSQNEYLCMIILTTMSNVTAAQSNGRMLWSSLNWTVHAGISRHGRHSSIRSRYVSLF